MDREILHLNIGSFSASVEQHRRADLNGRPVIVGVPRGNTSGVVFSASREARRAGVAEEMSIRRALRVCADAVVLPVDHAVYRQVFDDFLRLCSRYSPLLEPDALGCAWMDITGSHDLFGRPHEIAARIAAETAKHLNLSLSIGCASNKLVARIASGMGRKFVRVGPGGDGKFLSTLSVAALDAVNPKIEKRLVELGISKIGQLAQIPETLLVRQFGPIGSVIKRQSLGLDFSPVQAAYPPEVISIEHVCDSPLVQPARVEQRLSRMVDKAAARLTKKNALAGEVTLVIFDESEPGPPVPIPAYLKFKRPTGSAFVIVQALSKLLNMKMQAGMEISRLRIVLSDLSHPDSRQLSLVENSYARDRLDTTVEQIKERFGDDAVFVATSLVPNRGQLLPRTT
jgi:DNA polymerase-4